MEEENKQIKFKILGIILIFVTIVITYGFTIGIKGLKIKEYTVIDKDLPISFYGLKIVHFSDLHYGRTIDDKNIVKIINEINNLNGDIVVFTGDLLDRDTKINTNIKNILIENLSKIKSTYGNYFVGGNHDVENKSFYEIMENSNFINLEENSDNIYIEKEYISLMVFLLVQENVDISYMEMDLVKYKIFLMLKTDNYKYIKTINLTSPC